ncbi:DUF2919 family protein [Algicola sagamiensis]|uniref:DUF2919 family protein n=1 Tax=Algicola sagamiensis TaxID=163869 RepID=UPI00036A40A2|nr:DUF2919 family protein [Algicola sagamiensis]
MSQNIIYEPKDFDRYHVLKPTFGFWLLVAIQLRAILIAVVSITFPDDRAFFLGFTYPDSTSFIFQALIAIPATTLCIALARRTENGRDFSAWVWKRGKLLLLLGCVADTVGILLQASMNQWLFEWITAVLLLLNFWLAVYMIRSRRMRDVFRDWPEFSSKKD